MNKLDNALQIPRWARISAFIATPVALVLAATAIVRANVPNSFAAGDTLSAQRLNDDLAFLESRIATIVPPGTIIAFGSEMAPPGWLPCDGSQLDGTNPTYVALFAAIGTAYGGNRTSRAFNLPDLRGRFLRGWNDDDGADPDAASRTSPVSPSGVPLGGATGDHVGSVQGDLLKNHTHGVNDPGHTHTYNNGFDCCNGPGHTGSNNHFGQITTTTEAATTGITLQGTGGSETRPVNVAVNYVIKL